MTKDLVKFDFKGKGITVLTDDKGEPWWVAKEVCGVLGLDNVTRATKSLDADEKNTVTLSKGIRGNPNKIIINEPGLYRLISKSTKKAAREFKRWIFHDVLPSIRKNGPLYCQRHRA